MAPHDPKMVAALRRERAGYEARGLTDRVAQVDEQLAHYGADETPETPQGRTGDDPAQQTAAGSDPAPPEPPTAPDLEPEAGAQAAEDDAQPQRGRPRKPRDNQGNIIRE
jgi:hypothetical protein